jgi:hypothetical protein
LEDPELTKAAVRAEFYRAKRFFKAAPKTIVAARALPTVGSHMPGTKFAGFFNAGVAVTTDYGYQRFSRGHIGLKTPHLSEALSGRRKH